jgi:BolA protein
MTMQDRIAAKLTRGLHPESLDIVDESHLHKGHAGAHPGGESHFRVRIVAEGFAGKSRARLGLVYDLLGEELAAGVHALAVQASAPGEA